MKKPLLVFVFIMTFDNFGMQTKEMLVQTGAATEDSDCNICLESTTKTEKPIILLRCGHRFHGGCISRWLHKEDNCPICKEVLDKESIDDFHKHNFPSTKPADEKVCNRSCCLGLACGSGITAMLFMCFGA